MALALISPTTTLQDVKTPETPFSLKRVFTEAMNFFIPDVRVYFKKYLTTAELVKEIGALPNPQVIFWYMGPYGLRQDGVKFYKKVLGQLMPLKNEPNCLLYDLTAWAAFGDRKRAIDAVNQNIKGINALAIPRIRGLGSNKFFEGLIAEANPMVVTYLRDVVLKRPWLDKISEDFPEKKIKVKEVFESKCPILANMLEKDTGKSYSAFQYLEGIYLIDQILKTELGKAGDEINIVFALPNDEWKYYEDGEGCFAKDVSAIIAEKYGDKLDGKKVNLYFYTFRFGVTAAQCKGETLEAKKALLRRPYNSGPSPDSKQGAAQAPELILNKTDLI